jgi:hypothetical protein
VHGGVVQYRREFGGVISGKRLEIEPFRTPALVEIDHPSTIAPGQAGAWG